MLMMVLGHLNSIMVAHMDYWSLWLRVSVLFIQALGFRGLGYRIQGLGSKVFFRV